MFNNQWVYYADYKAPAPDEDTLKKVRLGGYSGNLGTTCGLCY